MLLLCYLLRRVAMAGTQSPKLSPWAWRGQRVKSHWRMEELGEWGREWSTSSLSSGSHHYRSPSVSSVGVDSICCESIFWHCHTVPRGTDRLSFLFALVSQDQTHCSWVSETFHPDTKPLAFGRFQEMPILLHGEAPQTGPGVGWAGHDRPSVWQRLLYLRAVWAWTQMFRMIGGWVYYSI